MIFAVMVVSAIIVYILLKKLPQRWQFHRKIHIQLTVCALLVSLLAYLLVQLYSLSLAVGAGILLLLFFAVVFGKQMEYAEEDEKEGAAEFPGKFTIDQDKSQFPPHTQLKEHDTIDLVNPAGVLPDRQIPGVGEREADTISPITTNQDEVEDSYLHAAARRTFIDESEDNREADSEEDQEEDELEALQTLRRRTEGDGKKEKAAEVKEERYSYTSQKRASLLHELEEEDER
ncbi:hypothetical protein [Bacillus piscicola]|uniref:hypothetical protein n=1 Tax=Bacillus piscicola TaxID=1632684 RepID=UPI001F0905CB|nr:hypothetical protein [Bacillus piscicola]